LDSLEYFADLRFEESGALAGTRSVRHDPGEGASGGDGDSARVVTNPVERMLPDDPPHLAPRTRDRYRLRLLPEVRRGGRRLVGAEAALLDPDDTEPVRRARSWVDADSGAPYSVEVWRASTSAIFDEESSAGVAFVVAREGILPAATTSVTNVDVPFGEPRRIRVDVAIRSAEQ
jgi:hypothetical protein